MGEEALVAARTQPGVDDRCGSQAAALQIDCGTAPEVYVGAVSGTAYHFGAETFREPRRHIVGRGKAAGPDAGADDGHLPDAHGGDGLHQRVYDAGEHATPTGVRQADGRSTRRRRSGHEHRHAVGEAGDQGHALGDGHQTIGVVYHVVA